MPHVNCPTLLLITGNQHLLYLITRYGERGGCRVLGAGSIERALELVEQERPDGLLLHLLSMIDRGWDDMRRLKAHPATAGLPVTIISAMADEVRARAEGAAYWLWQPVMYADFLAALRRTAVLPQATPAVAEPEERKEVRSH